jgi:hypothetical protein
MASAARQRRHRVAKEMDVSRVEPARLADLQDILAEVRSWDGVEDRGGGTYYVRRKPFLHFHVSRDQRRADVRGEDDWVQIELPEPASAHTKDQLLAVLRTEYAGR